MTEFKHYKSSAKFLVSLDAEKMIGQGVARCGELKIRERKRERERGDGRELRDILQRGEGTG